MGRHRTYDRDLALDRATRLFWAKGYEGTHVSELVEATGLNRFSLYNEFGGKEGLFRAALEHYVDGLGELLGILDREPLGLANVRAFHRAGIAFDFLHGCFALNTIREKHVVPESTWSIVASFSADVRERLLENLRAASAKGELAPERDPEVLATTLSIFDMGMMSYRSLGASPAEALRQVQEVERLLA